MTVPIEPWSPYGGGDPIVSASRRTLVSAFGDLVRCRAGFAPHELAEIFSAPSDEGENDACRHLVREDAIFLTMQLVSGRLSSFARPLGGGEAMAIPAAHWEIDDPLPRFATGVFSATEWSDADAPATHRIFVDAKEFEEWLARLKPLGPLSDRELEEALDPRLRAARAIAARRVKRTIEPKGEEAGAVGPPSLSQALRAEDELLTLPQVEEFVKLKRSAIYTKIKKDGFPKNIMLGGRAVWRKSEVMAWVDEKAAQGRGSRR
jgi:predicted DNA-binding transcriptional regulator AlpA